MFYLFRRVLTKTGDVSESKGGWGAVILCKGVSNLIFSLEFILVLHEMQSIHIQISLHNITTVWLSPNCFVE